MDRLNLYVDQDTLFKKTVSIVLEETEDFEDCEFFMFAAKLYSSCIVLEAEVNKLTIDLENPEPRLEIVIDAHKTKYLSPGKYVYDVVLSSTSSEKRKVLEGLLTITQTITRI